VTRADVQLLFDWLLRRYGHPGESEGSATTALVNSKANHQREPNTKNNAYDLRREQRHEDYYAG
jgi:hypothetical protein